MSTKRTVLGELFLLLLFALTELLDYKKTKMMLFPCKHKT